MCGVALAVAGALVACGQRESGRASSAATPSLRLGLVADTLGWGEHVGAQQDLARATGARWLREELQWSAVAPRRGARRWRPLDRLFLAAAHRGMHLLPLLNDAPAWAGGRRGALPTDARAYGAFVRDVVARYGPSGSFWRAHPRLDAGLAPRWFELWNEPYFARPAHSRLTARRYAALADAGIRAGRAADPSVQFLISVQAGGATADERWLAGLAAASPGLLAAAGGMAAHPYAGDGDAALRALDELTAALRARGSAAPLWVTEVGWSTCSRGAGCVTEGRQAADIRRFLTGIVARHSADAVFLYHLHSWRVRPQDAFFGAFGLLRRDDSHKPSWTVYRRFTTALAPADAG
jgi:hypothetical protein